MSKNPKKSKGTSIFSFLFGRKAPTALIRKNSKQKDKKNKIIKEKPKSETKEKANSLVPDLPHHWDVRRGEDLVFTARPLILIGLPMSKPKHRPDAMHLLYKRSNGNFTVEVKGDPQYGLPYGQDQLIILSIIDHALKNNSPKVEIKSIYNILKNFGMDVGGRKYKLMHQALHRIFGSAITYWWNDEKGSTGLNIFYFEEIRLRFLKGKFANKSGEEDYVVISKDLYKELKSHPIPYDLEVLRLLKNSPGASRLYLWAAPRSYRISAVPGLIHIPLKEVADEIGADVSKNPRKFKQNLKNWILKLDETLIKTIGLKSEIRIQDENLVLIKCNLVPGSHLKNSLSLADTIKLSPKTKELPTVQREFDVDWVLEKEIHEFIISGLTTSLSKQAIAYRAQKKQIYKGQYEDEEDLFPGAIPS